MGLVKLRLNKKTYLKCLVFSLIFLFLAIQGYAQASNDSVPPTGSSQAGSPIAIRDANASDVIYYYPLPIDDSTTNFSGKSGQSTTANAKIVPKAGTATSPQPAAPTTSTEQREAQIDPSQKPTYTPPPEDTTPVVVDAQESAMEQEERQIGSPQTNQVSIPSTTPNTEERQEAITEKEIDMNRCDELKNTNTINYTDEQVRRYKAEMEEVCTPDPDIPHDGAIELPRETEEDRLGGLILFKEMLDSLSEEEREAALKFEGMTMEYLDKEIERLRNLKNSNNTTQETGSEEAEKEEGGGFISAVTNIVVGLIDGIFSLFR